MRKALHLFFLIALLASGAESYGQKVKWSVRMANTVLASSDSLIHYVAGSPKWA